MSPEEMTSEELVTRQSLEILNNTILDLCLRRDQLAASLPKVFFGKHGRVRGGPTMGIMNQRYLTYPETQELYGVSKRTLQKLVVTGTVEAFRPGKETLMDSVMLDRWFQSTKIQPKKKIGRPRRGAVR